MAALAALGAPPVPEIFATMEDGPIPGGTNPGEAWLESHGRSLGHFVNGAWLRPEGRERLECREAATGRPVAAVPAGDSSDVAVAVAAAAAAAEAWAGLGGPRRGQHLARLASLLSGDPGVALGALLALGGGRPLCRTLGAELDLGLRPLRGLEPPEGGWRPLGVVALLLAGPCSLPELLWKLGPLLAMGNTAVLVAPPAAAPPLLLLAELGGEGAALPPGVLNVLAGPPGLPRALRGQPGISAITCAGAAQDDLRCHLWGSPLRGPRLGGGLRGGRLVVIVLDSADLDSAAAAAAAAATLPGGGSVLLAQDSVAPALERRLRARLGGLRLGDPTDARTEVGPLPPGTPLPEELLREAREEGAQIFQAPLPALPGGGRRFYPPTLISGVAPTSRCLREPVPGPVLVLLPVRGPSEAVAVASALPHAAAAALWAQDITVALDTADRLPQGLVTLNSLDLPEPFGGSDLDEALREFGCPPWEQPPKVEEPLSPPVTLDDPGDPELAQAMAAARGAAPGRDQSAAGGARGAGPADEAAAGSAGRGLGLATPPDAGAPPPGGGARERGRGGGAPWRRRCRTAAAEGSGGRGAAGGGPGGASRDFPGLRISPGAAAPGRAVAVRGGRGL
ncbi:aldehyde dehydrogenase family 16 member A1 isoform X1 [Camarhynchus parvulus]|uniref:aldehyde dehydrogenase family 16 member A1 isoform X1 n=1 Tax=Geospiza parvula TaxID=87175 RepID=UPI001237B6D1|nr:aldehyde dehydrogenase family 16 member A1 isoform X1 [Camarhynchus parvulus]XP_030826712.1 aldehyde dehydrogenase family 16 member A1 isoform X1 [Camarhynchus parvulus]